MVCARPVENYCPSRNPVYPASGHKRQFEEDAAFERLTFGRHYASAGAVIPYSRVGAPLSEPESRWMEAFDIRAHALATSSAVPLAITWPDGEIQYYRGDGTAVLPSRQAQTRAYAANGGFVLETREAQLVFDAGGLLRQWGFFDGPRYEFRYSTEAGGAWVRNAHDSLGVQLPALVPPGYLIEVLSTHTGRVLRLDRDAAGKLTQLWLPRAATPIRYRYEGAGDRLTEVKHADGTGRAYAYNETGLNGGVNQPFALTGILALVPGELVRRIATYSYHADGSVQATERGGGLERATYSYPAVKGASATVTPPGSPPRTSTYTLVNGVTQLASQSQPAGSGCDVSTATLEYDNAGFLKSRVDFNGYRTCLRHDARGLEQVRVEGLPREAACDAVLAPDAPLPAGARKIETEWLSARMLVSRRSEPGRITTFAYHNQPGAGLQAACSSGTAQLPDGSPLPLLCEHRDWATQDSTGERGLRAAIDGQSQPRTQRWYYNAEGQTLAHDGPRADTTDTTHFWYAEATQLTGTGTDASGVTRGDLLGLHRPAVGDVVWYLSYDAHGSPREVVDRRGATTRYAYDERRRLRVMDHYGRIWRFGYHPAGPLARVELPSGDFLDYRYDAGLRLQQVLNSHGDELTLDYDPAGNLFWERLVGPNFAQGLLRKRQFDALNRAWLQDAGP